MIISFEVMGIVGIFLEILGFIFMLMYYGKSFPKEEYGKWEKENVKEDEKEAKHKKFVTKTFRWESMGVATVWNNMPIHKKFWYKWLLKTKIPIILVIIGLALQASQLVLD